MMHEKIEHIRELLKKDALLEAAKMLVGNDNEQPTDLNYLRAVFAIKIGDFELANNALDVELSLYPDNEKAKRLKILIAEPKPKKFATDEKMFPQKSKTLVNLGCGNNWREGWINIDVVSNSPYVKAYDLRKGIPLENESADFVYSSHMLEHLGKREAENFIRECFRVLKKGGIIRIAVPDLETIAREYLKNLEAAKKGDEEAKKRYEWIMLELLDQTVRERSGGEMLKYWAQKEIPAYDYVIERVGSEAENAIAQIRASGYVPSEKEPQDPCEIGKFRLSGEIHKWMYDEFSLGELLKKAGFVNVKKVSAYESSCNEFLENNLDLTEDGKIRKPDSLFMEGVK